MTDIPCDLDSFGATLEQLLKDVDMDVDARIEPAVSKTVKYGAKEMRKSYKAKWGKGKTGKAYAEGFSSRTFRKGKETAGEVGNRTFPGLVNLLEKGHNTLAGRHIPGYAHVKPVYEDMVPKFEKEIGIAVEEALEG